MAYTTTTWAKVKADYESGNFTIEKLWKKYGISESSIEKKIIKEGWIKGENVIAIQQTIAEKNIELFAKRGMTQADLVDKLISGVNSQTKVIEELAERLKGEDVDTEFFAKIIPQVLDDRKVALDYMKEINKMCGSHAPVKKETDITSGGEAIAAPQIYLPSNGRD